MAFLLDDIVLAPLKGLEFIARSIRDEAMRGFLDEEGARKKLRELYRLFESGKISEEEFEKQEEEIVQRLEQIEAYKKG
ncbi:gas vesicle protein GvpG [Candidatus Aerophobetes bacterium]|nr:gas vesicle protein GvpG [Candidatus Aerophobetes bacterium]